MVGDDQVHAELFREVRGFMGGGTAVRGDDHLCTVTRELFDDERGQAITVDKPVRKTYAGFDAHHAQARAQHRGRVDAIRVIVGEHRDLLVPMTGSYQAFDGARDVLQQVRIIRVAAYTRQKV